MLSRQFLAGHRAVPAIHGDEPAQSAVRPRRGPRDGEEISDPKYSRGAESRRLLDRLVARARLEPRRPAFGMALQFSGCVESLVLAYLRTRSVGYCDGGNQFRDR